MTLSPDNVMFTYEAVKSLIENNYQNIHLNCIYEQGWENKHGTLLYFELKNLANYIIENNLYNSVRISMFNMHYYHPKLPTDNNNWCGGVEDHMLSVDYKGDFYPCIRYMESSLNNNQIPIKTGNIIHGLYYTDEEKQWKTELTNVTRQIQSTDECFNCPIAEGCGWCSAYNYEVYGTVKKRATFICPTHKAISLANAYYWNLIFMIEEKP
jgi:radical SAM peptide maturase (CXXX-repeat target family)